MYNKDKGNWRIVSNIIYLYKIEKFKITQQEYFRMLCHVELKYRRQVAGSITKLG